MPVDASDATGMGIFTFDTDGHIVGFEEKPDAARLQTMGPSLPADVAGLARDPRRPYIASMGIYLFSRQVMLDLLDQDTGDDFGRALIPAALTRYRVHAYAHRAYWADVGTIESFYHANIMLTRPEPKFSFYDPHFPIYTHARFLPPSKVTGGSLRNTLVAAGCYLEGAVVEDTVVGIRTSIGPGSRVQRSVLLGADYYETAADPRSSRIPIGIGRGVTLDRVIVDKNARIGDGARLVNAKGVDHADGDGYYIRGGIIIVPKDGVIPADTEV